MYMIIVISMIFVIHMIKYTYDKLCDMYYIMIQNTYTEEFNCWAKSVMPQAFLLCETVNIYQKERILENSFMADCLLKHYECKFVLPLKFLWG